MTHCHKGVSHILQSLHCSLPVFLTALYKTPAPPSTAFTNIRARARVLGSCGNRCTDPGNLSGRTFVDVRFIAYNKNPDNNTWPLATSTTTR